MNLDPARRDAVRRIFEHALERPPSERDRFLDEACGDDLKMRGELRELIEAHEGVAEFLADPTVDLYSGVDSEIAGSLLDDPSSHDGLPDMRAGTRVNRYRILQKIGQGGFGVVYMAEQEEPVRRLVALKIIKLGMDTREVVARFEAERQALAMMDHPNIARVLDAGATDSGRPYFVMDLVRGVPVTEYADLNELSTQDRLKLFGQICGAVQHAHQKGVIHRDIKPSNILITLHDAVPVPKIIDFGIAKATNARLTEKTLFTRFHQIIGTPAYMSPEQAEMSGLDIDTRADIYSLGVLLYELLTGTTPLDPEALSKAAYDEIQRLIREKEPPKPSTRVSTLSGERRTAVARQRKIDPAALSKRLRGDLDWIIMKALEKDRTRRYETASDLARDIERHLGNVPVEAGPPGGWYRARKFLARNRRSVATAVVILVALVGGLLLALVGYQTAREETIRSDREAKTSKAVVELVERMFDPGYFEGNQGKDTTIRTLLDEFSSDRLWEELAGEPAVEITLKRLLAGAYSRLGDHETVARQLERALELARLEYKEEARETLEITARLGKSYRWLSRFSEAVSLLEKAHRTAMHHLGTADETTLAIANTLAAIYGDTDRRTEARTLVERSLADAVNELGKDAPEALALEISLANSLRLEERTEEAIARLTRVIDLWRQDGRISKVLALRAMDVLASSHFDSGDIDAYAAVVLEAGEIVETLYGPAHPVGLTFLNKRLVSLSDQGHLDAAEPLALELLEALSSNKARRMPTAPGMLLNVGVFFQRRGQSSRAESLYHSVLELVRSGDYRDEEATRSIAAYNLNSLYKSSGKAEDAEPILKEAVGALASDADGQYAEITLNALADLYQSQGRYGDSLPLLQRLARVDPDDADVQIRLGIVAEIAEVDALGPGERREALLRLGVLLARESTRSAIRYWRRVNDRYKEIVADVAPDILTLRSVELELAGNPGEQAQARLLELRRVAGESSRARLLFFEGRLLENDGNYGAAIEKFRASLDAVEPDAREPEGHIKLAECLWRAGRTVEAGRVARAGLELGMNDRQELWSLWLGAELAVGGKEPRALLSEFPERPVGENPWIEEDEDVSADFRWLLEELVAGRTVRIDCGAGTAEAPALNARWGRDRFYFGPGMEGYATSPPTPADPVLLTERWWLPGSPSVGYWIPVLPGRYRFVLDLTEIISIFGPGKRVFDVAIEGRTVLEKFAPGHPHVPQVKTFEVDVRDSLVEITFRHRVNNPKLNSLQIERIGDVER